MKTAPDSPCIGYCSTALGDEICSGCGRTFLEVAQWVTYTPEDKARVYARLKAPRALSRLILAPMEGLADAPMRAVLTALGGIDVCVSEFIRVSGSLLPPRSFYKASPELLNGAKTPSGTPVWIQLLGSDPVCLAENAARAAELGAPSIDLNFGCPAKTVNRHGGGAALLKNPDLIFKIVEAVRKAVPPAIPVTAKMRLGYEDKSPALVCAHAMESGGAALLTVHARTKEEGYRPPAHWEWIAKIREAVSIEVVANGEVWSVEDANRCLEVSGCTQLMLGRGLVASPGLANEIKGSVRMTWAELFPTLLDFWHQNEAVLSDAYAPGRLKQWLRLLSRAYPEAETLGQTLRTLKTNAEIRQILHKHDKR